MTSFVRWCLSDLWNVSRINIDKWTETFSTNFYLLYTLGYPDMNWTARNNSIQTIGYILGSVQPDHFENPIARISAVTISADYRRLGLATSLINTIEKISAAEHEAKGIALYVRPTNEVAISLYKKMGYKNYRRILNYYDRAKEDGLDLRKSLSREYDEIYGASKNETCSVDDLSDE